MYIFNTNFTFRKIINAIPLIANPDDLFPLFSPLYPEVGIPMRVFNQCMVKPLIKRFK